MNEIFTFLTVILPIGLLIALMVLAHFGKRDVDIEFLGITIHLKSKQ